MTIATEWPGPAQVAKRLGLTTQMIHKLIRQGRLHAVMTANGRLIDPMSVEREIERRQAKA